MYKGQGERPPKGNTSLDSENKMTDVEKEEVIIHLSGDETLTPDYWDADNESENDPKHKRISPKEDQAIQEEISKIWSAIHLKTLNYDKAVDLLVTERLKNDKLYEKLQKLEIESGNLKSANRPKSQVEAASHDHKEQSMEDEITLPDT